MANPQVACKCTYGEVLTIELENMHKAGVGILLRSLIPLNPEETQ